MVVQPKIADLSLDEQAGAVISSEEAVPVASVNHPSDLPLKTINVEKVEGSAVDPSGSYSHIPLFH
jgi:hypothetical protein